MVFNNDRLFETMIYNKQKNKDAKIILKDQRNEVLNVRHEGKNYYER